MKVNSPINPVGLEKIIFEYLHKSLPFVAFMQLINEDYFIRS
jgi:hypothetical protein